VYSAIIHRPPRQREWEMSKVESKILRRKLNCCCTAATTQVKGPGATQPAGTVDVQIFTNLRSNFSSNSPVRPAELPTIILGSPTTPGPTKPAAFLGTPTTICEEENNGSSGEHKHSFINWTPCYGSGGDSGCTIFLQENINIETKICVTHQYVEH